jgi:hypothetical protein
MDKFLDVYIDENINSLIISGKPTTQELLEAWSNIHEEYVDLMGDNNQKYYLQLSKEAMVLKAKIALVESSIYLLSEMYVKKIADRLVKMLGGSFKFDFKNKKSYQKDIQGLINRSKSLHIEYKLKQSQVETLEQEQKGEQPTRESFIVIFINLRAYYKYHVPNNITVLEFCKMLKDLINHNEKLKDHGSRRKN